MKKFIIALILGVFGMATANAKTAVVYFSATGTTKKVAETTAKAVGGDLFEVVPEQAYTSADLNWLVTTPLFWHTPFGGAWHPKSCTRSLKARASKRRMSLAFAPVAAAVSARVART